MYMSAKYKDVLAVVAHDLKNYIGCIEGYARLLAAADDMAGEDCRRYCRILLSRCRAAGALLANLTETEAVQQGSLSMNPAPVSIQDIVRESAEAFDAICRFKGVTLSAHMPDHPIQVMADCSRIQQVLDNLIGNAFKYVEKGGRVTVVVYEEEDEVRIGVVDNGVGIAPEHMGRVFDKFFQVSNKREGAGLGLFIARTIVGAHDGEIGIHSAGLGKGTTVHFNLPKLKTPKLSGKSSAVRRPVAANS